MDWYELNEPYQKHHVRNAFDIDQDVKKHLNLQLESGIATLFESLLNNDKINFNKFVEKVLKKKPLSSGGSFGTSTGAANPGSFGGIVKSDPGKMVAYDPLIAINNALDNILQVLRNEAKEEEKHQNWLRRLMETYKRRKKENKLEFKILDGIKKTAETLLKPFRSAWQQLWDFISTVVLGRILFKLLEWVGNNYYSVY